MTDSLRWARIRLWRWLQSLTVKNFCIYFVTIIGGYILLAFYCSRGCDEPLAQLSSGRSGVGRFNDEVNANHDLPVTYLIVVIYTAPGDERLRQTIRDTWLTLSKQGPDAWRYYFPIGTRNMPVAQLKLLQQEQMKMMDLIFLDDLEESYGQLTAKTLAVLQRFTKMTRFNFMLKVDSDSFVRIGVLLKALKDIEHPRLYWGFFDGRAPVHRRGKWMEPEWKLCDRYLPYALGGGYILAYDLVKFIVNNARYLKQYNAEDVSVGAWLAGLNIKYVHDPRFDTEWQSRGCSNEYLITHKKNEDDLHRHYDSIVGTGRLCPMEFRKRGSYIYDWNALPSRCCVRTNNTKIP